jgi:pimeloyl-ACP methyl ester carboxylesterase
MRNQLLSWLVLVLSLSLPEISRSQEPAYPIILIHGLKSNAQTWQEARVTDLMQNTFFWGEPHTLDICLNADRNHATSDLSTDIRYFFNVNTVPKANVYLVNFDIDPDGSNQFDNTVLSNQAAIKKQGFALQRVVQAVLQATGKEQVILIGHSMGGLAAREYAQNPDFWQTDRASHVARVITIGSPNWGANTDEFLGWASNLFIDPKSEAVRDVRYNYASVGFPDPNPGVDSAAYLFGGAESLAEGYGYYNTDISCDSQTYLLGLNQRAFPSGTDFVWIRGRHVTFSYLSDGIVAYNRQFVSSMGTRLDIPHSVYHSEKFLSLPFGWPYDYELESHDFMVQALDAPPFFNKAWQLAPGGLYHDFAVPLEASSPFDKDTYGFELKETSDARVRLTNLPPGTITTNTSIRLFASGDTINVIGQVNTPDANGVIQLYVAGLSSGKYLFQISMPPTPTYWNNPYRIGLTAFGPPTQMSLVPDSPLLPANPLNQTTLRATLRDANGRVHPTATNPVTFSITSGAASAQLVGANPVNAVNGVATITLQATSTPGVATILATSPGLASATTTVTFYSNPTLVSGTIATNTKWEIAKSPYQVTNDIHVNAGITLTIEPGVTVLFNSGTDLNVDGAIVANGTATQRIRFTSSSPTPVPRVWGGIRLNAPQGGLRSSFNYCDFSYGGQGGFDNNTEVFAIDGRAEPQMSNCTFSNSRHNGMVLFAGNYSTNFQLNITDWPYVLLNDLVVDNGARLTIAPGVHLKCDLGVDLHIYGALDAQGTPSSRIVFTSLRDDELDGDTGGDGPTTGSMREWGGIYLSERLSSAQTLLRYCDFRFAGAGGYGNLGMAVRLDARVNPTFQALRFHQCYFNGIAVAPLDYYTSVTFNQTAAPYIFDGGIGVRQNASLTIAPGTLFKMAGGAGITVEGPVNFQGTASNPIRFTSLRDDSRGGDSANDGLTAGNAGDWDGIYLTDKAQSGAMKFCEFHFGGARAYGTLGTPMLLDLQANVNFANLVFSNCTSNGIRIRGIEYRANTRLRYPGNTAYVLFDDLIIASGAKLTIDPGCIIKLDQGSGLFIAGGLQAEGTITAPIIFTSLADDSLAGDTNNDGLSHGVAAQWDGIAFRSTATSSTCVMRHCQFRFGGQTGYGNNGWVLWLSPLVNPTFEHLRFVQNRANGIFLQPGSFTTQIRFDQTAATYLLDEDYNIEASGGLAISPGAIFKCYGGTDLNVRSRLTAVGTANAPIVFTSYRDDRFGGDTNNDGASSGVAGDWGGISFEATSTAGGSEVGYCEFWYGASGGYGNSWGALLFHSAQQKVHHTKFARLRYHGVWANGNAAPDFGGGAFASAGNNSFLDFGSFTDHYAVYNDGTGTIFAKNNAWEAATAAAIGRKIYDKLDNAGKGEVIFQPFLAPGDNEAPQVSVIFPNGGETLLLGKIATLRWFASDNIGVTQIEVALARDGGSVFEPIASFNALQEQYAWQVTGPFSSRCVLKVLGRDAAGNERFDLSDGLFAIVDSSSGVNYPPSTPLPLLPIAGEELRGEGLLLWQASVDPNPFDKILYRLEIDDDPAFASLDLIEDDIDSSRTSALPLSLKSNATLTGRSVIAIRLDRLSGYANLKDDLVYHWRVRARDQQNAASAFSSGAAKFFMNKTNTPPQAVNAGFSPANDVEVRSATPTISWQAAHDPDRSDTPNVLRYHAQMDTDGEFENTVAISVETAPGITFFEPAASLQENARWFYRVQARDDEGGASLWSIVQTFWVNVVDEPPAPFALLTPANGTSVSGDSVYFRWENTFDPDPRDLFVFVFEVAQDSSFNQILVSADNLAATQYAVFAKWIRGRAYWRVAAVDSDKKTQWGSGSNVKPWVVDVVTSVAEQNGLGEIPSAFGLSQNYPNPFSARGHGNFGNTETTIKLALPRPEEVLVQIYDLLGQRVRTLLERRMAAGYTEIVWDGKDEHARIVPSGVYLVRMQAREFSATMKMRVIR